MKQSASDQVMIFRSRDEDSEVERIDRMVGHLKTNAFSRDQVEQMLGIMGGMRLNITGDGCISDANATALEVLKYSREDLIGSTVSRILPDGITTTLIEQLASANVLQRMRCLLIASNKQTVPVFLVALVLHDQQNPDIIQEM